MLKGNEAFECELISIGFYRGCRLLVGNNKD
jgi:hypothetical protein